MIEHIRRVAVICSYLMIAHTLQSSSYNVSIMDLYLLVFRDTDAAKPYSPLTPSLLSSRMPYPAHRPQAHSQNPHSNTLSPPQHTPRPYSPSEAAAHYAAASPLLLPP